jgi:hypothetical protein
VHRINRRARINRDLRDVDRTMVRDRTTVRMGLSEGANDAETQGLSPGAQPPGLKRKLTPGR